MFVVDVGPAGGPRRQIRRRGFERKRDAQEALTKILADQQRGEFIEPSRQQLTNYLVEWLPAIQSTVELSTWDSYDRNLRNHVIPRIGHLELRQIRATDLSGLYARLLEDGRRDGKGGLSARTVRYIATIVHRALREAVEDQLLARNPADHARLPKSRSLRRTATMTVWTANELRAFLHVAQSHRLYPVFLVGAMTGMRRGEVLGLHWRDVDLDEGRLTVRWQLRSVRRRPELAPVKTKRSRRAVDLDRETTSLLQAHRRKQLEDRMATGPDYTDGDLVFAKPDGTYYVPDSVSEAFERLVRKSGLPRIRLHDLRHGWATLALQAGVHPKVVSDRLGHASIAVTLDTYSHTIRSLDTDAAEKVAGLIFAN